MKATRWLAVGLGCVFSADLAMTSPAPKELFLKHCASCHGPDGKARTPIGRQLGVKDLTKSRLPDADIEKQLLEGVKDKRGNQRMPSFKDKLTADEIKALITTAKSLRE